eukprot:TRINITY_DN9084_c0_g1_i2.p1 TRINITY_DN9084_c0_g1~~TRINITY_DN9084_c0_g1_i2.p1  ORF type:complete len:296 (-),score=32.46 TRINITY_DN9084_c0_g1_i2:346-1233(-)
MVLEYCQTRTSGGPVFAAPLLTPSFPGQIIIATQGGVMLSVTMDYGEILWRWNAKEPIIGSPCVNIDNALWRKLRMKHATTATQREGIQKKDNDTSMDGRSATAFLCVCTTSGAVHLLRIASTSTKQLNVASCGKGALSLEREEHPDKIFLQQEDLRAEGVSEWGKEEEPEMLASGVKIKELMSKSRLHLEVRDGDISTGHQFLNVRRIRQLEAERVHGDKGGMEEGGRHGIPHEVSLGREGLTEGKREEWEIDSVACFRLGGDLFSSPVMVGGNVVVGCRDEFVYSVGLSSRLL